MRRVGAKAAMSRSTMRSKIGRIDAFEASMEVGAAPVVLDPPNETAVADGVFRRPFGLAARHGRAFPVGS